VMTPFAETTRRWWASYFEKGCIGMVVLSRLSWEGEELCS